jgi:CRP-like cAMP-binding protein
MFFVLQGEVLLERTGVGGEPIVLQRTSRGFISEASLQSALYHCDARVANDAQVLCIPITALLAQLQQDPTFALRWIGMCNQEIRRLRLQCERRSIKTVQGRLIHLIETRGSHGQYSVGSDLKTVAAELGVTHEALYRTIATLEKAGRLRRENGKLMYV